MDLLVLKENKLGFPKTPSRWVGEPTYARVSQVVITYGGGMGGSNRTLTVREINKTTLKPNDFIRVTDYFTGKTEFINTRYIVSIKDYTLVSAKYMCSNTNFYDKPTLCEISALMSKGGTVTLTNDYKELRGAYDRKVD